jgi:hypothetical protein
LESVLQLEMKFDTVTFMEITMTARDVEAALLTRCTVAAREVAPTAQDQREANVFQVASMILGSQFHRESKNLMHASEQYFIKHPTERLASVDVVRNGWTPSLPRFHDMLNRQLCGR